MDEQKLRSILNKLMKIDHGAEDYIEKKIQANIKMLTAVARTMDDDKKEDIENLSQAVMQSVLKVLDQKLSDLDVDVIESLDDGPDSPMLPMRLQRICQQISDFTLEVSLAHAKAYAFKCRP